jgi:hypothetical protein
MKENDEFFEICEGIRNSSVQNGPTRTQISGETIRKYLKTLIPNIGRAVGL